MLLKVGCSLEYSPRVPPYPLGRRLAVTETRCALRPKLKIIWISYRCICMEGDVVGLCGHISHVGFGSHVFC